MPEELLLAALVKRAIKDAQAGKVHVREEAARWWRNGLGCPGPNANGLPPAMVGDGRDSGEFGEDS